MTIRTIHLRQCGVVLAAAAALTACTGGESPGIESLFPPSDSSASGSAQPGGAPVPGDAEAQQRRAGRPTIALGNLRPKPKTAKDLNAVFDPCGLSFADFPEQTRPTDNAPHAPEQLKIDQHSRGDVECAYDNSDPLQITESGGQRKTRIGKIFKVIISWNASGHADPTKIEGSTPRTWGARTGLTVPAPPPPPTPDVPAEVLGEGCLAAVKLQYPDGRPGGSAVITVADAKFDMPVCDIAAHIAGVIANRNQ